MARTLRTKSAKDAEDMWNQVALSRPGEFHTMSGASHAAYRVNSLGVMKRAEFFRACMKGRMDKFFNCRIFDRQDNARANELWMYFIECSRRQTVWLDDMGDRCPWRDIQSEFNDSETGECLFHENYQLLKVGWHRGFELSKLHRLLMKWREADEQTPETAFAPHAHTNTNCDTKHKDVSPKPPIHSADSPVYGPPSASPFSTPVSQPSSFSNVSEPPPDPPTTKGAHPAELPTETYMESPESPIPPPSPKLPSVDPPGPPPDANAPHQLQSETQQPSAPESRHAASSTPDQIAPCDVAQQVLLALDAFKKREFVQPTDQEAPSGFKLRVEIRKTGSSAGRKDFYVYTPLPERKKLRSVLEVQRFILKRSTPQRRTLATGRKRPRFQQQTDSR